MAMERENRAPRGRPQAQEGLPVLRGQVRAHRLQGCRQAAPLHFRAVKILPRRTTGTCAMHQRQLTEAIKRARRILTQHLVFHSGWCYNMWCKAQRFHYGETAT